LPYFKKSFPKFKKQNPYALFKDMNKDLVDIMMKFLEIDRKKRLSVQDALIYFQNN